MSEGMSAEYIAALTVLLKTQGVARVCDTEDGKAATYTYRVGKTLCLDIWNGLRKLYDGDIDSCPYSTPRQIGFKLQSALCQIHTTSVITHHCP